MKVALIGCGFLGSLFAEEASKRAFAYHEELEFTLVDPDMIEERNVANQLWGLSDVGVSKVFALSQYIGRYGIDVGIEKEYLDKDNSNDILLDANVLVCAVDNIAARSFIWERSVAMNLPLLTMGISQGGTGSVDWTHITRAVDTNPFSPMRLASLSEDRIAKLGKVGSLPPCELVGFRGLGLNVALAAAKALWIFKGFDAEKEVFPTAKGEPGTMTTWSATNNGHVMTSRVTPRLEDLLS